MEIHDKIRTLERDLEFLRAEQQDAQELRDSMHKDASYVLWKEQNAKVFKLAVGIDQKQKDIEALRARLQLPLFPR